MAKSVESAGGPPPYRVGEVARQLGVSNKAVLDALKRGRLSGFKLNRMWLIPRDAIDRLGGGAASLRDGVPMGGSSHGPEPSGPENAKRCPAGEKRDSAISQISVNRATDSCDAQQPQRRIFSPPDAPLAVLRAENALVVRVFRRVRRNHVRQGGRSLTELIFRYAEIHGDLAGLDALTADWLALGDPDWLHATGGDRFVTEWTIGIAPGSRRG